MRETGRHRTSPDFVEAVARGLDVIRALGTGAPSLALSEVADRAGLARPTAHRILLTLADLGYVRAEQGAFSLTPRVLDLGLAYVTASGVWDAAHHHLRQLVDRTGESCSVAQLDGSDVVYVARVAVPKLVTLRADVGTRFPAAVTSLGKVLLADLPTDELHRVLDVPSRSGVTTAAPVDPAALEEELARVRDQGWAATDQLLAPAVRSVAAPVRGAGERVVAAVNVNAHALETSMETLVEHHLPLLLETAAAISADLARLQAVPSELRVPSSWR